MSFGVRSDCARCRQQERLLDPGSRESAAVAQTEVKVCIRLDCFKMWVLGVCFYVQ